MLRSGICVVSGIYPPESGGPAKFAATFSKWASSKLPHTSVVTLTDEADYFLAENGVTIRKISRQRNLISRYLRSAISIFGDSKNAGILVNGMFLEACLMHFLSGKKYVVKIPGDIVWERARNSGLTKLNIDDFQNTNLPFKYKLFRAAFTLSLRSAKKVIVPSSHLKNLVIAWGIQREKIELIYNSISLDNFSYNPMGEKNIDVITVSRLVTWKGLDEVILACSTLNLNLTIVGDGPERLNLENLALKCGANVNFLGDVAQNLLPNLYARSKYFVLNSTFEATSYALLEARACGVFSIANSKTGSEDVIHHRVDGLLCKGDDGFTVESALKYAMNNQIFVDDAKFKARERTEELFNMEINFKRILELTLS